jgi:hypothetical protein
MRVKEGGELDAPSGSERGRSNGIVKMLGADAGDLVLIVAGERH